MVYPGTFWKVWYIFMNKALYMETSQVNVCVYNIQVFISIVCSMYVHKLCVSVMRDTYVCTLGPTVQRSDACDKALK